MDQPPGIGDFPPSLSETQQQVHTQAPLAPGDKEDI